VATKKGILITIIILVAISGASFVIWFLPQDHSSFVVVSDYKNELDSIKERHSLISTTIESNLKGLLDKNISPDEFTNQTQVLSSQVTSLISELIESNPPSEWKQSYAAYFESLKKYNEYIFETNSFANKMKNDISKIDLNNEITKLDSLKKESDALATKSYEMRP